MSIVKETFATHREDTTSTDTRASRSDIIQKDLERRLSEVADYNSRLQEMASRDDDFDPLDDYVNRVSSGQLLDSVDRTIMASPKLRFIDSLAIQIEELKSKAPSASRATRDSKRLEDLEQSLNERIDAYESAPDCDPAVLERLKAGLNMDTHEETNDSHTDSSTETTDEPDDTRDTLEANTADISGNEPPESDEHSEETTLAEAEILSESERERMSEILAGSPGFIGRAERALRKTMNVLNRSIEIVKGEIENTKARNRQFLITGSLQTLQRRLEKYERLSHTATSEGRRQHYRYQASITVRDIRAQRGKLSRLDRTYGPMLSSSNLISTLRSPEMKRNRLRGEIQSTRKNSLYERIRALKMKRVEDAVDRAVSEEQERRARLHDRMNSSSPEEAIVIRQEIDALEPISLFKSRVTENLEEIENERLNEIREKIHSSTRRWLWLSQDSEDSRPSGTNAHTSADTSLARPRNINSSERETNDDLERSDSASEPLQELEVQAQRARALIQRKRRLREEDDELNRELSVIRATMERLGYDARRFFEDADSGDDERSGSENV